MPSAKTATNGSAKKKNHTAHNANGLSEMYSEPEQIFVSFSRPSKMGRRPAGFNHR